MDDSSIELRTKRGDYISVGVYEYGRAVIVYISFKETNLGMWLGFSLAALLAAVVVIGRGPTAVAFLIASFVLGIWMIWKLDARTQRRYNDAARATWRDSLRDEPDSVAKPIAALILNDDIDNWVNEARRTLLPELRTLATGGCSDSEQQRLYAETNPDNPVRLETKNNPCWMARARVAVEIDGQLHEYTADDSLLDHGDDMYGEWATLLPHDDSRPSYTFDHEATNLGKLWTWWNAPGPPAPPLKGRIPNSR